MNKDWRHVVGYEGLYEVSSKGVVRSASKKSLLSQHTNKFGYKEVRLFKLGKLKLVRIHRIVAISFIDNPMNKKSVNHINGIKTDNRVVNLEWCTQKENVRHSHKMGLTKTKTDHNKRIKVFDNGKETIYKDYFQALDATGIDSRSMCNILNKDKPHISYKGIQVKYIDDLTPWKQQK